MNNKLWIPLIAALALLAGTAIPVLDLDFFAHHETDLLRQLSPVDPMDVVGVAQPERVHRTGKRGLLVTLAHAHHSTLQPWRDLASAHPERDLLAEAS